MGSTSQRELENLELLTRGVEESLRRLYTEELTSQQQDILQAILYRLGDLNPHQQQTIYS